jgi:NitT/TauT family transport system substrate-binding protein
MTLLTKLPKTATAGRILSDSGFAGAHAQRTVRISMRFAISLASLLALAAPAAAQKITIAVVPSVPGGVTYIAADKGYFRDAGLDVDIERIDSLGKAVAFLATNQVQVAQGGINAGFYNSVAQGLPVILALESGSSPTYHQILVRTDLKDKIKTPADLKGRTIGLSSAGSTSMYEVSSVLASAGLALKDVEGKNLAFSQMAAAMANGAIDAAIEVAPFTERMIEQNIGVRWIDPDDYIHPLPMTSVGYIVNTDWASANAETARKLFVALARAGRDYCQAYHHAPIRAEIVDIFLRNKIGTDRDLLDRMAWQSRDPNGKFNVASIVDMQSFFQREGTIDKTSPAEKLVDESYAAAVAKELGPFELINKASPLKGCR